MADLGPNVGVDRLATAIDAAVKAKTPGQPDWHEAVGDTLDDLEKALIAAEDGRSADAAMNIRLAIGSLAGIWHDADGKDAITADLRTHGLLPAEGE